MSDLEDHQRRITAALGRMQRAYEAAHDAAMEASERAAAAEAERDALAATLAGGTQAAAETAGPAAGDLVAEPEAPGEERREGEAPPLASDGEATDVAWADEEGAVAGVDAPEGGLADGPDRDAIVRLRAELAGTAEALEAERAANAELTERLTALRRRESVVLTEARTEAEAMQARLSDFEDSCYRLRMANAQLRRNAAALRAAHAAGLPDAALINETLQAELDALQATRAADRAELDSILSALGPMIAEEEAAHG